MHPDWVRGLRDQVHAADAKIFVKQIGSNHALWPDVKARGEDPGQQPADLRVQGLPAMKYPTRQCALTSVKLGSATIPACAEE
jgi:hypothetical protein